jgi:ArsR family transcriptional regulator
MNEFMLNRLRKLLDILGNDTRCRILDLLNDRPRFISEISRELEVGQQAILRHLDELEDFGLLNSFEEEEAEQKRKGRKRKYYEISPKANYRMIISIDKDDLIFDLKTPEMPAHLENLSKIEEQIQNAQKIPNSLVKLELYHELMNHLEEEIEHLDQARYKAIRLLAILKSEFK